MAIPLQQHHSPTGPCGRAGWGGRSGQRAAGRIEICNMNCAYCECRVDARRAQAAGRRPAGRRRAGGRGRHAIRLLKAARADESLDRLTVAATANRRCTRVRGDRQPAGGRPRSGLRPSSGSSCSRTRRRRRGPACGGRSASSTNGMRLDAGDPSPTRTSTGSAPPVGTIVDALRALPRVVVRSMFVRDSAGRVDNTTEGAITEWVAAIAAIQPRACGYAPRSPAGARGFAWCPAPAA